MFNYSTLKTTSTFPTTLFAIALFILLVSGCAQKKQLQSEAAPENIAQSVNEISERVKKAQSEGCRTCHSSETDVVANVFNDIFETPKVHHPVGVIYPAATAGSNFAPPSGEKDGIVFFDRNGNGQPDDDEIMMFGATGEATVECASCHVEHEGTFATWKDPTKLYLRFANTGSAMCTTCHQY